MDLLSGSLRAIKPYHQVPADDPEADPVVPGVKPGWGMRSAPWRAFYLPQDHQSLLRAFVQDSVQAQVPLMSTEELFTRQGELEARIKRDVTAAMQVGLCPAQENGGRLGGGG